MTHCIRWQTVYDRKCLYQAALRVAHVNFVRILFRTLFLVKHWTVFTNYIHKDTVAWEEDEYNGATNTPAVYVRQGGAALSRVWQNELPPHRHSSVGRSRKILAPPIIPTIHTRQGRAALQQGVTRWATSTQTEQCEKKQTITAPPIIPL